jgi:prophage antirepressor-like protein
MNELTVLLFEEKTEVRTLERDGELWWVAKDVCDILGLGNVTEALRNLPDNERMTLSTTEGHSGKRGGAQSFNLVNEPGLYRLIFQSRKPEAERFKMWVFTEVLPSIRRKGYYIIEELKEKVLSLKLENEHQKLLLDAKDDIPLRELKVFIKRNIVSGTRTDWILGEEMYDRYAKNVDNAYPMDFFIAELSRTFPGVLLKMYRKNHMLYGVRKK